MCGKSIAVFSLPVVFFLRSMAVMTIRGLQADSWDLFAWDGQSVERITNDIGEFGEAHWVFGQQRYAVLNEDKIIAIRTIEGRDHLVEIDVSSSIINKLDNEPATSLAQLSRTGT